MVRNDIKLFYIEISFTNLISKIYLIKTLFISAFEYNLIYVLTFPTYMEKSIQTNKKL